MRFVLASLALSLSLPAAAADLQWSWEEGQHRRYFMQAGIKFQSNLPVGAELTYDFAAQDMLMSLVADCEASATDKKGRTTLSCDIEDIALLGAPGNSTSAEVVSTVLTEWQSKLSDATYLLTMSREGRILRGELTGITFRSENRRTGQISTAMEMLIDRVFASIDMQLPKAGKPWEEGWIGKNSQTMMIPTASGGAGGSKIKYSVDAVDGANVDVLTEGHGTMMEGMDADKSYSFDSTGIGRFDAAAGHLVARAYRATGTLTASSISLPGRQTAAAATTTDVGAKEPGGSVGAASALNTQDAQFLSGGTYDPDVYLEVGRMYLLGDDEKPNLGATGPLLYPSAGN
ncbi:MAG: hypothetical protein KC912_15370 [Proteobacteria bacterium]|nr:hypothetical protein [Pseudomonadota bacterium]